MRCKSRMLLLIGVVATACGGGAVGDDDTTPFQDGPPTPDAAPGDGAGPRDAAPAATCTCLVLGADFTSGTAIASTVALPSLAVVKDVVPVQADPVVRALGGRVFLINRFGADNVTVVDPADWTV